MLVVADVNISQLEGVERVVYVLHDLRRTLTASRTASLGA